MSMWRGRDGRISEGPNIALGEHPIWFNFGGNNMKQIFQKYNEYVDDCLWYGDSIEEVMPFDEWAETWHDVDRLEARRFYQNV